MVEILRERWCDGIRALALCPTIVIVRTAGMRADCVFGPDGKPSACKGDAFAPKVVSSANSKGYSKASWWTARIPDRCIACLSGC